MNQSHCYEYPHPAVTTDVVVFTIREQRLQLLLVKRGSEPFKGHWALQAALWISMKTWEACAKRELQEETGVSGVYLEQLYTFGKPDRDPRSESSASPTMHS